MRGPSLIAGYLDALAGQLPGPVVEELAGGLEETYRRYLGLGLSPEAAARAARWLLAAGPVVGACWAVALPVPARWPGGYGRMRRHRRVGWFHDHRRPGR